MANYLRTLITFLVLGISSLASAQLYVTDDNFAHRVQVHQYDMSREHIKGVIRDNANRGIAENKQNNIGIFNYPINQ